MYIYSSKKVSGSFFYLLHVQSYYMFNLITCTIFEHELIPTLQFYLYQGI